MSHRTNTLRSTCPVVSNNSYFWFPRFRSNFSNWQNSSLINTCTHQVTSETIGNHENKEIKNKHISRCARKNTCWTKPPEDIPFGSIWGGVVLLILQPETNIDLAPDFSTVWHWTLHLCHEKNNFLHAMKYTGCLVGILTPYHPWDWYIYLLIYHTF